MKLSSARCCDKFHLISSHRSQRCEVPSRRYNRAHEQRDLCHVSAIPPRESE